jgi:hypothetical protein
MVGEKRYKIREQKHKPKGGVGFPPFVNIWKKK